MVINMEQISSKLAEVFKEILDAVNKVSVPSTNPKEIIAIAEVIKKGEKKVAKEYTKRMNQLIEIKTELERIEEFAAKMGYILTEQTDTETETESTPEPEISATIGNKGQAAE